tara:strand:- start:2282 stop:2470 length:189 start_codon:yes stop_codon:yes gene_type:complete
MNRFNDQNTEGYTTAQLAELNAAYSVRLAELHSWGVDVADKSTQDHTAERLLADFDACQPVG